MSRYTLTRQRLDWFVMILLLPLFLTIVLVRFTTWWLDRRGSRTAAALNNWPTAAGWGMAAVFVFTGVAHFVEPQRSGLIAIVPEFVPAPALAVTVTGVLELVLAAGLIYPRTRRWSALATVLLLLALFPANIVAAGEVDHPAAPTSPLVLRAILQLIFITAAVVALLPQRQCKNTAQLSSVEEKPAS